METILILRHLTNLQFNAALLPPPYFTMQNLFSAKCAILYVDKIVYIYIYTYILYIVFSPIDYGVNVKAKKGD